MGAECGGLVRGNEWSEEDEGRGLTCQTIQLHGPADPVERLDVVAYFLAGRFVHFNYHEGVATAVAA
jgi:hypothetical protein